MTYQMVILKAKFSSNFHRQCHKWRSHSNKLFCDNLITVYEVYQGVKIQSTSITKIWPLECTRIKRGISIIYYYLNLYSQETSIHPQSPNISIFCHIFFHISASHEVRHLVLPWLLRSSSSPPTVQCPLVNLLWSTNFCHSIKRLKKFNCLILLKYVQYFHKAMLYDPICKMVE